MKDLKSNRQLTNLVRLVLHLRELTTGGGHQLHLEGAQFSECQFSVCVRIEPL